MGLRHKAISGVTWKTVAKVTGTVVAIFQLAIIARFIDKADFGLLAIVNVVLGFTAIFTDLGLTSAMLYKQDITNEQYSSIYWFNWLLNGVIFLIVCSIAPLIATFYKDPRLTHLIILMGTQILISPLGKVFATIKTKNLEFSFISKITILTTVAGFLIVAIFAPMGFGLYSLIFASIFSQLLSGIIYSVSGRKVCKIMFFCRLSEIRIFLKIGIYEVGKQILDYFSYKIDVLLVGRFFGMQNLGIYNLGKELILKPLKLINPLFTEVAIPIFAKIQNDLKALGSNYLKVLNILSFLNFPFLALLFAFAGPVVVLQYGAKYTEVEFFVRALSLWGMFAVIGNPAGILEIAKGRTDLGFRWTVIRVLTAPVAVLIASLFSIKAVAYSQVILRVFFYFIYWRVLIYPLSEIPLIDYIGSVSKALICSLIGLIISLGFNHLYTGNVVFHLIFGCSVFGLVYLGATFVLNKEVIILFQSLTRKKAVV